MTSHPAFNDMFVSTFVDERLSSLIAKRTSRSFLGDCYAALKVIGVGNLQYESNLGNFIGRERGFDNPIILDKNAKRDKFVLSAMYSILVLRLSAKSRLLRRRVKKYIA